MEFGNQWYAVQVRSRFEKTVAAHLEMKGYEQFLPLSLVRRRSTTRVWSAELPLVPGYVFCRIRGDVVASIVTTPGVVRIVSVGGTWLPIEEGEIEALRRVVESGVPAEPWSGARAGDPIEILHGPLAGLRGTLARFGSTDRLLVSVTMLNRAVAVEIDRQDIRCLAPETAYAVRDRAWGDRAYA